MADDQPDGWFFMGIDGGGSNCRARLRDGQGRLLASIQGGSANVHSDLEGAVATIKTCIDAALDRAKLENAARNRLSIGLGLAGASSRTTAEQVETALAGFHKVRVVNDAITACMGAHAGQDGGLIIAGTGSAGAARVAGQDTIIGGRGFILGDDGSGARIGLEAWRRALRAHDGFEPATDFTRALMAHHADDPVAVIRWALRARPSDFGAFAPVVFSAAKDGDPIAHSIVAAAAVSLAEMAAALTALGAQRIALVGGLADPIRPYLPGDMAQSLTSPLMDAVEGAILLVDGVVP